MQRFDLTFKGEVLPKHDPKQVRMRFAELFHIKDLGMLEKLFCGDTFVLRSNLDRRTASDYFHKVSELGGLVQLVAASSSIKPETDSRPGSHTATSTAQDVLNNLQLLRRTTDQAAQQALNKLTDKQDEVRRNTAEQIAAIADKRILAEEFAAVENARLHALQADTQRDLHHAIRELSQQIVTVQTEASQKIQDIELAKEEQRAQHHMEHSELQTLIDLAGDDTADELDTLLLLEQEITQQGLEEERQLEKAKSAITEQLSRKLERLSIEEQCIGKASTEDQN